MRRPMVESREVPRIYEVAICTDLGWRSDPGCRRAENVMRGGAESGILPYRSYPQTMRPSVEKSLE